MKFFLLILSTPAILYQSRHSDFLLQIITSTRRTMERNEEAASVLNLKYATQNWLSF